MPEREPDTDPLPEDRESATQGTPKADPARTQSPGAGCLIMIAALASLTFLVGFGVWNLFKQHREISKFTETSLRKLPLPDLETNAPAVIKLNAKLETFRTEAGNKREAALRLSPEEINLAFAAFEEFKELRGTFSVTRITEDEVRIDIAFKMRGAPTKSDDFRYLNGTMVARPELTGGEIIFVVESIEVPGRTVPEGFVGVFSPYRPAQVYLNNAVLGPWMKKLTSLTLEEGFITLAITPSETPPAAEPPQVNFGHILRACILFGAVLLGFIATVIFAVKRGKARK